MTEPELSPDPIAQFVEVYKEANEKVKFDASAMVLSTCTKEGRPSSRVVLLKDVTPAGFVFYTNYFSRKSRDMSEVPYASLCFYWAEIDVQVRIEGKVKQVPPAISDAYFATRPRLSQVGAWASDQSQPLRSREVLLTRMEEFEKKYEGQDIPRPAYWGGFILRPESIEFWYNGEFRLHDRFLYTWDDIDEKWVIHRLNP